MCSSVRLRLLGGNDRWDEPDEELLIRADEEEGSLAGAGTALSADGAYEFAGAGGCAEADEVEAA